MAANTRAVQSEARRCKIGRSGTEISTSLLCKLIYYSLSLSLRPQRSTFPCFDVTGRRLVALDAMPILHRRAMSFVWHFRNNVATKSPFPIDKSGNVDVAAYLGVLWNESSTCIQSWGSQVNKRQV